ncbi:MAG: Hsp20/alpha crystallin family protein [Patescibacteria group bacterium]|nr:Hsp20/alpha crystallin family protein [Patescibacteria group bacterium]
MLKKRSFFERLAGGIHLNEDDEEKNPKDEKSEEIVLDNEEEEKDEDVGELTVDLYHNQNEIIIKTMISGVQPNNMTVDMTRDMITIKGKREEDTSIDKDDYFIKELFWGSFSRTVSLPEEIDPETAEAIEKHGLLIIKLPKINKDKKTSLKVKSV